jgi:hypothetical protein
MGVGFFGEVVVANRRKKNASRKAAKPQRRKGREGFGHFDSIYDDAVIRW